MKRQISKMMKKENRRGSALIISLTMITLLLFLAMIYAFEARAEARLAKSASDSTQARFAAKGAINVFLSLITNEMALAEVELKSSMNPAVSFRGTKGFQDQGGFLILVTNAGSENTDIDDYLTEPYLVYTVSDSVQLTPAGMTVYWQKQLDSVWYRALSDDETKRGNYDNRSLRSMAYVVIDYTGAMSPDYNNAIGGARSGEKVSEIIGSESIGTDIFTEIGLLSDSYTSLTGLMLAKANFFLGADYRDSMLLFNLSVQAVPEQYWDPTYSIDPTDSDSMATDEELFERIDITELRATKASMTELYDLLLGVAGNPGRDNMKYFCPWLKSLNVTVPVAREIAAQFVVNVCDRIDTDDDDLKNGVRYPVFADIGEVGTNYALEPHIATNPSDFAMNGTITSRVFGVDNHLGLSSFTFELDATKVSNTISISLKPKAKMVNCMDALTPLTGEVEFEVKLTFYTSATASITWEETFNGKIILNTETFSDESREVIGDLPALTATSPALMWDSGGSSGWASWRLDNVEITKLIVRDTTLSNIREVRNYPLFHDRPAPNYFYATAGSSVENNDATAKKYHFGLIARDPHFSDTNGRAATDLLGSDLFTDSWIEINKDLEPESMTNNSGLITSLYTPGVNSYNNGTGGTNLSIASADEYYGGSDQDALGGRFTRVGELGRMPSPHTQRRSLRFWTHTLANNTVSGLTNTGAPSEQDRLLFGSIAEGRHDAYLLSMFKAGAEKTKQNTVSVNGSFSTTFRALFKDITPDNVGFTVFTEEVASNALLEANGISGTRSGGLDPLTALVDNTYPMSYRGEIYRMFPFIADAVSGTSPHDKWKDKDIDEFIERFIELTTARQNYYKLYVAGIATSNTDAAEGTILAAHRLKAMVYRDAWKNTVKLIRVDAVVE